MLIVADIVNSDIKRNQKKLLRTLKLVGTFHNGKNLVSLRTFKTTKWYLKDGEMPKNLSSFLTRYAYMSQRTELLLWLISLFVGKQAQLCITVSKQNFEYQAELD